jgi:hypothetical protein
MHRPGILQLATLTFLDDFILGRLILRTNRRHSANYLVPRMKGDPVDELLFRHRLVLTVLNSHQCVNQCLYPHLQMLRPGMQLLITSTYLIHRRTHVN